MRPVRQTARKVRPTNRSFVLQKEELRARFPGTPGDVVNFFAYVADEVRAELARLGVRSIDEIVGRADMLAQRPGKLAKTSGLDLSFLTTFVEQTGNASSERRAQGTHSNGPTLDDELLADQELLDAIEDGGRVTRSFEARPLSHFPHVLCAMASHHPR